MYAENFLSIHGILNDMIYIYTQTGINNGYSYAPYLNLLIRWENIVFDRHIRPARGNTRTKLGNMDRLLGLSLVLHPAGLCVCQTRMLPHVFK